MALLEVEDLNVAFDSPDGVVAAVNDVTLCVEQGEFLGIVGESGSGKSQTAMAIMGLLAANGRATGAVRFQGRNLLDLPTGELNRLRGNRIAMVFQDPMTALNPYFTVAQQMTEVCTLHQGSGRQEARRRAIEMLDAVHMPDAARRIDCYPHEFSGGMRQRVLIAMALICAPELLVADEPTTALDVTVQAQILELLQELRRDFGMAVILISHDLGVVAGVCDRVQVMYAGRTVEEGTLHDIFQRPHHPYTQGLLHCVPRVDDKPVRRLDAIPGNPPNPLQVPSGCAFEPRCAHRLKRCRSDRPALRAAAARHHYACHLDRLP